MTPLRDKIVKGVLWSAIDVFFRQGLQFVVWLIMARILSPDDFGIIALLGIFVGLANTFIDGGFSSALIQKQNITHTDESTVFFFNLAAGLLTALVLYIAAPYIAHAFEKPILEFLTYAMALNVFISAIGSIHATLLTKELNFKLIAKVGGIASFLSGALALVLGLHGGGVWSLALQTLAASVVSTLLLWSFHPWRPLWTFSFSALRSFFRFGGYLMIIGIVDTLHINLYSVLIGKFYQISQVGFYDRAQKTQQLPFNLIMLIINRVAFSTFSAMAVDQDRLARAFRKAQCLVMFINIPLTTALIVLAEPLVVLLFGEKWRPSAPILQVLGGVGLMLPMQVLNINVLKAQGRSDLFFNIMLIKKTLAIGLTIAGSYFGIIAIAWAQVVAAVFSLIVNAYYSKIMLGYGVLKQLRDLVPSLTAGLAMAGVIWLAVDYMHFDDYLELALALLAGGATYMVLCLFFRVDAIGDINEFILKRKKPTLTTNSLSG